MSAAFIFSSEHSKIYETSDPLYCFWVRTRQYSIKQQRWLPIVAATSTSPVGYRSPAIVVRAATRSRPSAAAAGPSTHPGRWASRSRIDGPG
jgi:hypothetical protein